MNPSWIWLDKKEAQDDSYAEFKTRFISHGGNVNLKISSDSFCVAYINGELVFFTGCADYPHYKLYDEVNIGRYCKEDNELYVIVWYHGTDTQTYLRADPGLWFEVCEGNECVAVSSKRTLGRINTNFKQGYRKIITNQLGYSFYYDNTVKNDAEYIPCVIIDKIQPVKRPQQPLVLTGREPANCIYNQDHILVDLGREVAGYVDLEFESDEEQELLFTYGEHLEVGKVLREVGGRDFSFEFKAKKGKNTWFIPLRRIACRYIEIYFKSAIDVGYIGLQHVYYPVSEIDRSFGDDLLDRIYSVSVRTLRLCMHEHYEDCPWREQALYALDSRNQMLFGYAAFGETEYAKSNLLLINQGLRDDGLLAICFPAGRDVPIPFFSLAFILQVAEYVKFTGDYSLIKETEDTISKIIATFERRKGENGLIPTLEPPYWNFYEWSEGNDGDLSGVYDGKYKMDFDLILNSMFVYALNVYNEVAGKNYDVEPIANAIKKMLYDDERGLYKISLYGSLYGQLGNAMAILAGIGSEKIAEKIAECHDMTPATLSMKPFIYDALLKFGDKYEDYIIEDIKSVYKKMLDYGATSFWETELGWRDFENAGSLCHGWSASPVYYLTKILNK